MQGRTEHKMAAEQKLIETIKNKPEYLQKYYYSLNTKSHTTKNRYILNILRFLDYHGEDVSNIDTFEIERFMDSIKYYKKYGVVKELGEDAIACMYCSLNSFTTFLALNGYIAKNPFDNRAIQRPKAKEKEITFLTPDEVRSVEQAILNGVGSKRARSQQSKYKYRDMLLFRIPVINGIRVTALGEIDIDDLDLEDNSITVTEKGNITKKVYFDSKTREYLIQWMCQRKEIMPWTENRALFISNKHCRLTTSGIEDIIMKYTQAATNKHITPHKLRSTCGTNLYQAKKDIYLVADVLGHKSTAPTKRYTKVFDEDRREAINTMADLYD